MAQTAAFFIFLSVWSLNLFIGKGKSNNKIDISKRLSYVIEHGELTDARKVELKILSFTDRMILPFFAKFAAFVTSFFPAKMIQRLQPKIHKAGNPGNLTAREFLTLKFLLTALAGSTIYFLLNIPIWQVVLFVCVFWYIPELYLKIRSDKRNEEIEKTLPDIIDLLTVSVEAGLGFDSALAKVAEKSKGIVADEFKRVLKENRMGKARKESLKDMSDRLGEENIVTFIGSIVQAEQLGISFSKVLRVQSEQVRHKRRQRVEEAAMKAPIKMLIPLVFFIFPTIFIVLLGPAAIRIFITLMMG